MYTKWLVAGILAIGVGVHHMKPAMAQGHPTLHKQAGDHLADIHKLMAALSLTPEQMEAIHGIMKQHIKNLDAAKSNRSLTEVQVKERMLAVRRQTESSLTKVFTAEQLRVLNAKGGVGLLLDQRHATPFDMLAKLNLTQEQAAQVKVIIAETHRQMDAIKTDKTLSEDQMKLRMEQVHHQAFQSIHAILTAEQLKKLQEMHSGGNKTVPPPHH